MEKVNQTPKNINPNRFRLSKGKSIPFQIRIFITLLLGIVFFFIASYADETYKTFVVLIICASIPAIWFSERIIEFDFDKKIISDKHWVMGWKFGKTLTYKKFEGFRTAITDKKYYKVYHIFAKYDEQEIFLLNSENKDDYNEKLSTLKQRFSNA